MEKLEFKPLHARKLVVNYPALTDGASWFNEGSRYTASPQALLPAVPED